MIYYSTQTSINCHQQRTRPVSYCRMSDQIACCLLLNFIFWTWNTLIKEMTVPISKPGKSIIQIQRCFFKCPCDFPCMHESIKHIVKKRLSRPISLLPLGNLILIYSFVIHHGFTDPWNTTWPSSITHTWFDLFFS